MELPKHQQIGRWFSPTTCHSYQEGRELKTVIPIRSHLGGKKQEVSLLAVWCAKTEQLTLTLQHQTGARLAETSFRQTVSRLDAKSVKLVRLTRYFLKKEKREWKVEDGGLQVPLMVQDNNGTLLTLWVFLSSSCYAEAGQIVERFKLQVLTEEDLL